MPPPLSPEEPVTASPPPVSTLAPLKRPVFRMLWSVWLAANMCMWMNDVAAAWLMTSMTTLPAWVALVQTASTLPVFLLGLPSGALADILDRKRYFVLTQFWVAAVAVVVFVATWFELMSPPLLLALTFANGIGLAMRWPVFAAIVPELVPRVQLPSALALNGIAMNASRVVGPLVAGAIIAGAGTAYVFALNALVSVVAGFVIMRWRREHVPSPLGRERLFSAMRVGMQYVRQSARLKSVLLRVALFFFHSTALLALLPLVARALPGKGATAFTLLLAAMGVGAISTALLLPRLRQTMTRDAMVMRGALLQSVATAAVAISPNVPLAALAMFVAGAGWISTANSLSISAQLALPDWVRARGMSMYQMAIMGGSALGAATWGQVATWGTIQGAMIFAALSGAVAMAVASRLLQGDGAEEDLSPSGALKRPVADAPPSSGYVQLNIEYRIDPARAEEFRAMMQESRRSHLRRGALAWDLLHDIGDPGRFIEQIVDESWTEHLRRFDRLSVADVELRERKRSFHIGEKPPLVSRYVLESTVRD